MTSVRISDEADRALLEALTPIARDNPVAAVNLIADLQADIPQVAFCLRSKAPDLASLSRFLTSGKALAGSERPSGPR